MQSKAYKLLSYDFWFEIKSPVTFEKWYYLEYRPQPEVDEDIIITIEFTPEAQSPDSEYQYTQPEFRFGDIVATRQDWKHCYKHSLPESELETFRICAMELVDSLTPSGELLSQPR